MTRVPPFSLVISNRKTPIAFASFAADHKLKKLDLINQRTLDLYVTDEVASNFWPRTRDII